MKTAFMLLCSGIKVGSILTILSLSCVQGETNILTEKVVGDCIAGIKTDIYILKGKLELPNENKSEIRSRIADGEAQIRALQKLLTKLDGQDMYLNQGKSVDLPQQDNIPFLFNGRSYYFIPLEGSKVVY